MTRLEVLNNQIVSCRQCDRLVQWRESVACEKRAAYRNEHYWGRPVPGFGDANAALLVCGLAPAAHGGNRTGRVFTGDRSGDWLFAALHRAGFANQATSLHRNDGLCLANCYVTACVRCAPPANRPTPGERDTCAPYLLQEIKLLKRLRVIVSLGAFAWDGVVRALRSLGHPLPCMPRFGHGVQASIDPYVLLASYHPSQQNTFTGKLTRSMLDEVFERAADLVVSK